VIAGDIEIEREEVETFVLRVEAEYATAHIERDRRRKPCLVCHRRKRYSPWQPTCGTRECRLAWAPPWRPERGER